MKGFVWMVDEKIVVSLTLDMSQVGCILKIFPFVFVFPPLREKLIYAVAKSRKSCL